MRKSVTAGGQSESTLPGGTNGGIWSGLLKQSSQSWSSEELRREATDLRYYEGRGVKEGKVFYTMLRSLI